jgi:hypothetical protein
VHGQGHYDEITGFDEFVGLDPNGLPTRGEFLPRTPGLIKSVKAAVRTDCPRHVQFEARSHVLEHGVPVLAVGRVDCRLNDLHILLCFDLVMIGHAWSA